MTFKQTTSGLVAALAIATGFVVTQPAEAQYGFGFGGGQGQVANMKAAVQNQIQQGVASGRLTPYRAQEWQNQLTTVEMQEARSMADGYLSPRETQHLMSLYNRLINAIGSEQSFAGRYNPYF
jgi:hypothetical protein